MRISYEESIRETFSSWVEGNSEEAISELVTLIEAEKNASFSAGYAFAKDESEKVKRIVEALSE